MGILQFEPIDSEQLLSVICFEIVIELLVADDGGEPS